MSAQTAALLAAALVSLACTVVRGCTGPPRRPAAGAAGRWAIGFALFTVADRLPLAYGAARRLERRRRSGSTT